MNKVYKFMGKRRRKIIRKCRRNFGLARKEFRTRISNRNKKIIKLHNKGLSNKDIALKFGLHPTSISHIIRFKFGKQKKYRKDDFEKQKQYNKEYYQKNKEKISKIREKRKQKYYQKIKIKIDKQSRVVNNAQL